VDAAATAVASESGEWWRRCAREDELHSRSRMRVNLDSIFIDAIASLIHLFGIRGGSPRCGAHTCTRGTHCCTRDYSAPHIIPSRLHTCMHASGVHRHTRVVSRRHKGRDGNPIRVCCWEHASHRRTGGCMGGRCGWRRVHTHHAQVLPPPPAASGAGQTSPRHSRACTCCSRRRQLSFHLLQPRPLCRRLRRRRLLAARRARVLHTRAPLLRLLLHLKLPHGPRLVCKTQPHSLQLSSSPALQRPDEPVSASKSQDPLFRPRPVSSAM